MNVYYSPGKRSDDTFRNFSQETGEAKNVDLPLSQCIKKTFAKAFRRFPFDNCYRNVKRSGSLHRGQISLWRNDPDDVSWHSPRVAGSNEVSHIGSAPLATDQYR